MVDEVRRIPGSAIADGETQSMTSTILSHNSGRIRFVFCSVITWLLCSMQSMYLFADEYPRLGAYEIAGHKRMADSAYRENLSKHDIVILGLWKGWQVSDSSSGETLRLRSLVQELKSRAAQRGDDIMVGKYTIINEVTSNTGDMATRDIRQKIESERGAQGKRDWYARTSSGGTTSSWGGTYHTNLTDHVTPDAAGMNYAQWRAKRDFEVFFNAVPELDIWYFDNWFFKPRVTADWDGNGSNDSASADWVGRDFRAGMLDALRMAQTLAPDTLIMGNVDGHPDKGEGMLTETEYRNQLDALYEFAIGENFSTETWGGWHKMMQQYRTTLANTKSGKLVFLVTGKKEDYQLMRYGLASALMDNGYFYYTDKLHDTRHLSSAWWYDEFDVNLGKALQPPSLSAWKQGVYMREFEGGMAIVNPKGNGTQQISIPEGFKRVDGTQDRTVNNGSIAESVTLNDRDGIILIRTAALAQDLGLPEPPAVGVR